MAPFDLETFLFSVNAATIALAALVGVFMGVVMGRTMPGYFTHTYLFWQLAAGFAFFVPLAILRGTQGSETWARLFGTGVLWGIFIVAQFAGATLTARWRR